MARNLVAKIADWGGGPQVTERIASPGLISDGREDVLVPGWLAGWQK